MLFKGRLGGIGNTCMVHHAPWLLTLISQFNSSHLVAMAMVHGLGFGGHQFFGFARVGRLSGNFVFLKT